MGDVSADEIGRAQTMYGFNQTVIEGHLMLVEVMAKVCAGYYVSHTENLFLRQMKVLRRDNTANKRGRKFLCEMLVNHSNRRPKAYNIMTDYRQ